MLTLGSPLLPGSAQVGMGGDKGRGVRGLRGEKGRGVQGLRGKRERRWGGCSRVGPQEWAQGESGASACDRVGVPGGADPAPRPPRWPCGPLPRRGGPAPLFPSTHPHLEQALPGSRGGPHGPPPSLSLTIYHLNLHLIGISLYMPGVLFNISLRPLIML